MENAGTKLPDPETLFMGRFTAFRRSAEYKILEISTPEHRFFRADGLPDDCRIRRPSNASGMSPSECGEFFVHDIKHFRADEEELAQERLHLPGLRLSH